MKLYVQGLKKDFDEKQVLKGASFCFEQFDQIVHAASWLVFIPAIVTIS